MRDLGEMHRNGYAGFWIRAAARVIDFFAIITAYYLFYLVNQLGAKAGFLPPIGADGGGGGGAFTVISVLRGLFLFSFPIFYFTYLHGAYGQTFGKMAMGVRVLNVDGTPLSYWQAFRRWMVEIVFGSVLVFVLLMLLVVALIVVEFVLAKISSLFSVMNYIRDAVNLVAGIAIVLLSNIPLGIMFIPAAFDPRKQGLHDRICHTLVVRVEKPDDGAANHPGAHPPSEPADGGAAPYRAEEAPRQPPVPGPAVEEDAPLDKGPDRRI